MKRSIVRLFITVRFGDEKFGFMKVVDIEGGGRGY